MVIFSRFFGAQSTATPISPITTNYVSSNGSSSAGSSLVSTGGRSAVSLHTKKHDVFRDRHKSLPDRIGWITLSCGRNLFPRNTDNHPYGTSPPILDATPYNLGIGQNSLENQSMNYDTFQYNMTGFLNDLRRHTRAQKAMRGYFTVYQGVLLLLVRDEHYFISYPNARRVIQRYFNVLKEEYFIMLTQMRVLKRELVELHEEFADLCDGDDFVVPMEEVPVRGYQLEHILRRAVEAKFKGIDMEADHLRTGLHCCKLLIESFWRQNYLRRKKPLLDADTWANEAWNQWLLDTEEGEEDIEHRNSWWNYHWISDLDELSTSEMNLLQERGEGWWKADPKKNIDKKSLSEVSGCLAENHDQRPTYRTWEERRFKSSVQEQKQFLTTTGTTSVVDVRNSYRKRYDVSRVRGDTDRSFIDDNELKRLVQEADKIGFNGPLAEHITAQNPTVAIDDPTDMRYRRYGIAGVQSDTDQSDNTCRAVISDEQNEPKKQLCRIVSNYPKTRESVWGLQRIQNMIVTNNWRFSSNLLNQGSSPRAVFGPGGRLYDAPLPPADGLGGTRESWRHMWSQVAAGGAYAGNNSTIVEET